MKPSLARFVALAVAVTTAGCAGPEGSGASVGGASGDAEPSDATLEALNRLALAAGNATVDDWYMMHASATPAGHLLVYRWTVPNGSVHKDDDFDDRFRMTLEFAPSITNDTRDDLAEWALVVFRANETNAVYNGHVVAPALKESGRSPAGAATTVERPPSTQPFYVRWFTDALPEGTAFYFVLAARGAEGASFGLAMRALDEVPSANEGPVEDFDAFVSERKGRTPRILEPVATGEGLRVGTYVESAELLRGTNSVHSEAVKVEESTTLDGRPAATSRSLKLSAESPTSLGWSIAVGTYLGSLGPTTWGVDVQTRGAQLNARGTTLGADTPLLGTAASFVSGYPSFSVFGDGDGASSVTFALSSTEATLENELALVYLDLGTPASVLTGLPGHDSSWRRLGGLPGPPIAAREERGALVWELDGSTFQIVLV